MRTLTKRITKITKHKFAFAVSLLLTMHSVMADDSGLPKSVTEAIQIEKADALPRTALYNAPDSIANSKAGDLLKSESFAGYTLPEGATAVRILYHSLDATQHDVVTSGVVLIPAGQAPAGGWPVIAWAHGTSGVARMCAPSLQKDVYYGEEGLMPMVRAGFAVVATDYHGLGTDGAHQYVNKIAQSNDVIYSVPAARKAVPSLGAKWVVDGHSQGGMAAWGVAEAETKLQDPTYLGAVSVAGAINLQVALSGFASGKASAASFYLPFMAFAVASSSPDSGFVPSALLTGPALQKYEDVTKNGCWYHAYASFLDVGSAPLLATNWQDAPALQHLVKVDQLAELPVDKPLFVIGGEADMSVLFPMLKDTVQQACRNGVKMTFRSYPGLDHDPTMELSTPDQLTWIRERFAGKPALNSCPMLEAAAK